MESIMTGKVRLNYVVLDQPKVREEGKNPKYSVCLLIPKKSEKTLLALLEAMEKVKKQALQEKWQGIFPEHFRLALRDGDLERPDDEAYKGHYFLNASSLIKPVLLDANKQPIVQSGELYSGCYGRAVVSFYAYSQGEIKGIGCHLLGIQKLAEGEPLGTVPLTIERFSAWLGKVGIEE